MKVILLIKEDLDASIENLIFNTYRSSVESIVKRRSRPGSDNRSWEVILPPEASIEKLKKICSKNF